MTDLKKCLDDMRAALEAVAEEVDRVEREAIDRTESKSGVLKGLDARMTELEEMVGGDRRHIRELRITIAVTYDDGTVAEVTE